MEAIGTSRHRSSTFPIFAGVLVLLALVLALLFSLAPSAPIYSHPLPANRLEMKKSSGRNDKHANQDARDSAAKNYQRIKEEIDKILNPPPGRSPQKTPEEKQLLKKLLKQLEHWRRKKDWTGETHSRTPK